MTDADRTRRWAPIALLGLVTSACADRRDAATLAAAAAQRGDSAEVAVSTSTIGGSFGLAGCAEALAALSRMDHHAVRSASPQPIGLVLLEEPGQEVVNLRLDLPVPVVRAPANAGGACLLLVEVDNGTAERRVVGREKIWSERTGPVERRPNPEYETARREVARLADRLDREDREQARDLKRLTPTGNAWVDALGLVGGLVLGGIGSLARDREFEEAKARLESIPRWIEETRSEPYQVTVADTELIRRATVRLALIDREGSRFWATSLPIARTDRLRVAIDLHPRDRGRLGGQARLLEPQDLDALASTPPPVTLSDLLPHLVRVVATGPGRYGGPFEARLAWRGEPEKAFASSPSIPAGPTGGKPLSEGAGAGRSVTSLVAAPGVRAAGSLGPSAELTSNRPATRETNPADSPAGQTARSASPRNGEPFHSAKAEPSPAAAAAAVGGPPAEPTVEAKASPEVAAALVRVEGPGDRAHGFYVARDKVLTLARALGGSSLALIETADGFVTWGVVAREWPGSELLLVHVPRPGRHLAIADRDSAPPDGPLPAAGLPVLRNGRVVAVSLDPIEGRSAGPAELARIVAEPAGR
jgi:hypothetical protein